MSELQRVFEIANTAHAQLFWTIDTNVYWSWGVSKRIATTYKGMPTLCMKVSGAIHKGWVYISLNEGQDVYEVFLLNNRKREIKHLDEVYCDNLGRVIDGLVERAPEMSDEQYKKLAFADSEMKLSV